MFPKCITNHTIPISTAADAAEDVGRLDETPYKITKIVCRNAEANLDLLMSRLEQPGAAFDDGGAFDVATQIQPYGFKRNAHLKRCMDAVSVIVNHAFAALTSVAIN